MRFLINPTAEAIIRARPPVRIFLVFAALVLSGTAVQRAIQGGFSPAAVEAYYLGSAGSEALSQVALWEEVHLNAFVYGFLTLMLGSLLLISPVSPRLRMVLLLAAAGGAFADLLAPFAIVLLHGAGALRAVSSAVVLSALLAATTAVFFTFGKRERDDDVS